MALAGVQAPHDLAVVAAPVRLAGSKRPVAVLVAETRASGSRLHKFILLPQGALLPLCCPVQRQGFIMGKVRVRSKPSAGSSRAAEMRSTAAGRAAVCDRVH